MRQMTSSLWNWVHPTLSNSGSKAISTAVERSTLSVLTWNVWFEQVEIVRRYDSILDTISKLQPDVACLQEVIPSFLKRLKARPDLLAAYDISDTQLDGSTIGVYGVLTMAKKELNPTFEFHKFPSRMGRQLLLTVLSPEVTGSFAIGNVHLESLSNHPTREAQLEICANVFSQYDNYVLVGDYNFCSYRNYNDDNSRELENHSLGRILPQTVDLWPALHTDPHDYGHTFNGNINPMVHNPHEVMRYDRICARLLDNPQGTWKANSIQMLGDEPILEDPSAKSILTHIDPFGSPPPKQKTLKTPIGRGAVVEVFPSDHFGLFAEFSRN